MFSIWWIISLENWCVDNLNRLHCWLVRCITLSNRMAIIGLSCGQPSRPHSKSPVSQSAIHHHFCQLSPIDSTTRSRHLSLNFKCCHLVILVKKWTVHPSGFQTPTRFVISSSLKMKAVHWQDRSYLKVFEVLQ